ncbi:uncharacterized protein LOC125877376 [Solanum stenotomum]|uniref:uncharacterized protein LOC125877376 n=1 Tax=Solanum stenotomum TaxID=172797 RepID=UPI0020D0345B|nr:uncharacterized protein LOC125877376 [Solanum stenotomum]
MSVNEYALMFTQLAKYAPTIVADSRAMMSKFVLGIYDAVVKECSTAMLIKEMAIFRLMIHSQQIVEKKLKERARESKRARTGDDDFSHSTSGGYCRSKFWQRFFWSSCGKSGHKVNDYTLQANKGKDGRQALPSGSGSGAPCQNTFDAHQTRQDYEGSPNVVIDMLKVFHFDVYALIDPDSMLSFATPYVAMRFDVGPKILLPK